MSGPEPTVAAPDLYRDICENANDLIYTFDLSGRFTFANAAAERLLGYDRDEIANLHVHQIIAPDRLAESLAMLDRKRKEGGRTVYELDVLTKSGRRLTLEINSALIVHDGRPVGIQGIARDVTERKSAEQERRRLDEKLSEMQRLESLALLAGGLAHEFNNILTGILGRAELALMELTEGAAPRTHVEEIVVGGRRAAAITAQMLAYSGGGRFVLGRIDLSELIRDAVELLRVTVAGRGALIFDLADELPLVEADATQLRQACVGLVHNAAEALAIGQGAVTVRTAVRPCDATFLAECRLAGPTAGEFVVVEVSDDGCGMTPEVQARMFDPFFSTKFVGRGLGLAAVLGIVRGHKGTLWIDSAPGRGTTVRMLLPAIRASSDTR